MENTDNVTFINLPSYAWHLGIDSAKLLIVLFKVVNLYDNRCDGCWASDKLLACYCFGCTISDKCVGKKIETLIHLNLLERLTGVVYGIDRRVLKATENFFNLCNKAKIKQQALEESILFKKSRDDNSEIRTFASMRSYGGIDAKLWGY